jgi:amino acid transporter
VNAIIGSGIFIFPGLLAQKVGPASILVFGACGLMLVCVALCYAELGSMFRDNGGSYVYAREAFGPFIGFAVGWISWVTSVFSWAAVASAVSPQLGEFHSALAGPFAVKTVAILLILGFGLLNYYGIKLGAWTVNFFTIAKLIPLLLFVVVGAFYVNPSNYTPFWNPPTGSLSAALFLALWPLQGFEVTPIPSGESHNPQRAVPIAAVGSLLCAALIYVLIQAVAVGVHPRLAEAGPKSLAEAAAQFMGHGGRNFILVGAVISMVGYNAGNALGCPRFLSALAQDGHLPSRFSAMHPRFHTPSLAIILTSVLTAIAVLGLSFESLVDLSNFVVILQYVSTCAAVIWLRVKRPEAERRFRISFGIPVALAGCAVSIWLIKEVKLTEFIVAGAVTGVGMAAMLWFRRTMSAPAS